MAIEGDHRRQVCLDLARGIVVTVALLADHLGAGWEHPPLIARRGAWESEDAWPTRWASVSHGQT
jgi:hypothetical protein